MTKEKMDIVILDTSVILDDVNCIFNILNKRIIIPYSVLEELDKKKKSLDDIGKNARKAIKIIDDQNGDISVGSKLENGSILQVVADKNQLLNKPTDQKIIDLAINLKDNNNVIILSQDICMRIKARSLNVQAESYGKRIKEKQAEEIISKIYSGIGSIEFSQKQLSDFYEHGRLDINEIYNKNYDEENEIFPNQFLMIEGAYEKNNISGIGIVKNDKEKGWELKKIKDYRNSKNRSIKPKNIEQNLLMNLFSDDEIVCTSVIGQSGVGKSMLALEAAFFEMMHKDIKTIYLTKPLMPISKDENQGFYPGTYIEKMTPWLGNFFTNLEQIMSYNDINDYMYKGVLKVLPIALCRGMHLERSVTIADEVQNWDYHTIKSLFTRVGNKSKIYALSDPQQIDNPYLSLLNNGGITCTKIEFKRSHLVASITLKEGIRSKFSTLVANVL